MSKQDVPILPFEEIGTALDAISWDWLSNTHPDLAGALEDVLSEHGIPPEEIRRYVMAKTQRYELALRCEQAARYLLAQNT